MAKLKECYLRRRIGAEWRPREGCFLLIVGKLLHARILLTQNSSIAICAAA
jgi:hypothetical protein